MPPGASTKAIRLVPKVPLTVLGPHNTSLRVTVFTKKDRPVDYADDGHDRFTIDGWHVDLTHTPAKVTRAKRGSI